jgi:TRAP-type C4-dicarboxylate transport system permease large subunit
MKASPERESQKQARRREKAEAKMGLQASLPPDHWERFRILTDCISEARQIISLSDHRTRYALIIIGVLTFSFAMGVTGLPQQMTAFVSSLHLAPVIVLSVILLVYLALGAIMDSNTVMFVTIPIVTPLITGMGYDLVWWGIINLVVLETGLITPPFGIHLFVLKSIAGADVPLASVYRGVLPFVCADLLKLLLLVLFPALVLWLPSTMIH